MIQARAIVIHLDGKDALVESTQGGGCGNCDTTNGCGSSKLSQLFCSEPRRFRVRNDDNAQVGTFVQIVVPDGMLLHSALLMYILPLVLLLLGAILGAQFTHEEADSDVYSVAAGFVGLVLGFAVARSLSIRRRFLISAQLDVLSSSDV